MCYVYERSTQENIQAPYFVHRHNHHKILSHGCEHTGKLNLNHCPERHVKYAIFVDHTILLVILQTNFNANKQ